jgi:site-specific recombinase XerD
MKLSEAVNEYVAFKQSIGMRFNNEASTLKSFCRTTGDMNIKEIKPDLAHKFLAGNGSVTAYWYQKFTILAGFYRFSVSRGYVTSSPLPARAPKRPENMKPYIYTIDEIRRLLLATEVLETSLSPLQATTIYTLLLTLYGTGLRISEALGLKLADVNIEERIILVHSSKFYKSRLVPTGPQLTERLSFYAGKRLKLNCPAGENSNFFATRTGNAVSYRNVSEKFRYLRCLTGIHRESTARYQPRIHDLRATFAIHRLTAWYREGKDVQRLLPKLSTYLGHVGIAETQRYLEMTPELLQEASLRFEHYAIGGAPCPTTN